MNKRQLRTIEMGKTTLVLLDSKATLWNGFVPVVETIEEVRTSLATLDKQGLLQADGDTTGHTQNKEAQKERMCDLTLNLVRKLRAYARRKEDNVLLKAIDFSRTELRQGTEEEIRQRCQFVHDKGLAYLSHLAAYQVTAESLQTIQTGIDNFTPLASQRDVVEKTRVTTTANIGQLVSQLKEDLVTLDDLIASMVDDAEFVAVFNQARQLKERGRQKKKVGTEATNDTAPATDIK